MIYAYTGKTGSGKTFFMVEKARKAWLSGTDIYSNTILLFSSKVNSGENIKDNPESFTYLERLLWFISFFWQSKVKKKDVKNIYIPKRGNIFYFQEILEIIEVKDGLILFDEAQVLFNARNWEGLPNEFQYKLQQHRKHNLDLICTTQNLGTIDITYRRLVHEWIHCERGFCLGKDRVFFGIFYRHMKDIDMLYNSIDDLKTPTITTAIKILHRFKKRYYDTYFDIGFKSIRSLCLTSYDHTKRKILTRVFMIPKKLSLSEGLRLQSLVSSQLNPKTSRTFKKT